MSNYDESNIQIFKDLEGVRKRPAMYIGELGAEGIFHLVRECVENSVDEFISHNNSYVVLKAIENEDKSQSFIIGDKGRGIPVGKHKSGINTLTAIFTILHAGGKFDDKSYKFSRGVHGVGVSVTNALSSELKVWTFREGNWYYQIFKKGIPENNEPSKLNKTPSEAMELNIKKGTIVKFTPDYDVLSHGKKVKVIYPVIEDWLSDIADLNSGIKIKFITQKKELEFYNEGGPAQFVEKMIGNKYEPIGKCFVIENENLTAAVQWTESDCDDKFISYVNCASTSDGGTHFNGFFEGLTKAFKEVNKKSSTLSTQDLKLGIVGFINYKMSGSEFDSQKKDKLITVAAKKDVSEQTYNATVKWLVKHKQVALLIINRALALKNARLQFKELSKSASKIKGKKGKIMLPGKLTQSTTRIPEERELYLVEGDSAAGTSRKARYSQFQEVLSLKGKVLNVARATTAKAMANEEIQDIITAIGINISGNEKSEYRIGKVIFLCDSDADGHHIEILLATLLQKIAPELFKKNMVYTIDSPLYIATHNTGQYYGDTFEEVRKQLPKSAPDHCIIRVKGWGESSWETLKELAFNVKTRKIVSLTPLEGSKEKIKFNAIVNEDSDMRKELLGVN